MILHAFYNSKNIGDVLLVRLCDERNIDSYLRQDDVCVLKKGNKIIGYNIFNASLYFNDLNDGKVRITENFVEEMNDLLDRYNYDHVISDFNDHFVVAKVIEMTEHPDSDHMHICKVDDGTEVHTIVCGAPNVQEGQLVVMAQIGAVMPSGLIIKPSSLRGIESNGMLCSARELALENAPMKRGILVLDEDKYSIGQSFFG
ncbi:MAG: DUF4479 domain-containing protein [Bacilli bacterium]|nr:DUF4479 domain-containing protein [Bacilli bacterium]